jgi:ATP-dependent RNA helicase RhlE
MPFASLGLPEPIMQGIRAAGYAEPTPIQRRAIPLILPGQDLVAAAQTGSGKTAAFLLPVLTRLLRGPRALRALVLVPTRELAAQVESVAREYARFAPVRVGAVFGGVPIGPQERLIGREGVELLVATPGRLLDLHERQALSLDDIEVLVLDEADRMVDMGFAPDLRRIIRLLPKDRQTLMFSATMPPELNAVARDALTTPQRLDLGPPVRPATGIDQVCYPVPRHLKADLLDEILVRAGKPSTLIFTRTKHGADRLARGLRNRGHSLAALHGDRSQSQRERALSDFRRGRIVALVATDLASRGIDVDHITHVINYDVPRTPEDYVHRIGRTGRMNAGGDALTLMSPEEHKEWAAIERALGRPVPRIMVPGFDYKRRTEKAHVTSHDRSSGNGKAGRSEYRGERAARGSGRRGSAPAAGRAHNHAHVAPPLPGAKGHGRRRQLNVGDRRSRKRM